MIKNFKEWSLNEGKEIPYMAKEKLIKIVDDATSTDPTEKSFIEMFAEIFKWEVEYDVYNVWENEEMAEIVEPIQQHFYEFGNLPESSLVVEKIKKLFNEIKGNPRQHKPTRGYQKPEETPSEPKYDEMSKKEIQDLIDQALDVRDFDTVKKLAPYLDEEERLDVMEKLRLLTE